MVIEALALGVIVSDDENYYMVTRDEWKRRKRAEETHAKGEYAPPEDRMAGSARKVGTALREVTSRLSEKLPEEARISSNQLTYDDVIQQLVDDRKESIEPNLLCDLYEALYFEGYTGTEREQIDLATTIRPAITFILKRDFGLNEDHIFRPSQLHQELLREIYIGPSEVR
jgi:hypothetical protein